MDKRTKKQIKKYIAWALAALGVALLAVMPLLASQNAAADGPQASILSASAQLRSIETRLVGGGQLTSSATEDITIPAQVKLTEYLVNNGDSIRKGDPLARVDKVSVLTALSQVQETLDYLAEELADASKQSDTDTVKAHAGGLVKILYAQPGDSVRDVMLTHGALAVLSLDGRMAVDIPCDMDLQAGDTVILTLPDGSSPKGRVETNVGGILTLSVEDDGYPLGETVTAETADGTPIGSGQLYVHNAWNAAAYDGTVSKVSAKEGQTLSPGKTLFSLEVSDYSAQFQILAAQRQEYEELMQELFILYDSGVVTAPRDGLVTGVDKNGSFLLSAAPQGWQIQLLANTEEGDSDLPPEGGDPDVPPEGGDPEPPPAVTYEVGAGQVIAVNPDGTYTLNTCTVGSGITSIPAVSVPTSQMTVPQTMSIPGPVLLDDLATPYPNAITVGDILYFVRDSNGNQYTVWDGNRSLPTQQQPDQTQMPSMGSMMMGGMGAAPAPAFEPYTLETLTIATLTSQEKMTLEVTFDEGDIASVFTGQEAAVTVEALPGQTFPAQVTSVSNTGTNSGGSSKYTAKLTLGKSGDMLPGMHASGSLILETAENVLTVPVAALVEENGKTLVYTGYDEKTDTMTSPAAVTTGRSDGEYVQILEGLTQGDTVWYAYYDTPEISNIPESPFGF